MISTEDSYVVLDGVRFSPTERVTIPAVKTCVRKSGKTYVSEIDIEIPRP